MLYSMTGFGRAEGVVNGKQVTVDIKSLNGKQFELSIKLPPLLRPYELDMRSLLNNELQRGTLDFNIAIKQDGVSKPMAINTELALYYYDGMTQIAGKLGIPQENMLSTLMRMPEIVVPEQDVLTEEEWTEVRKIVARAAAHLMEHRKQEGASIEADLTSRINNIESLLEQILPLEAQRTDRIKTKINTAINELVGAEHIDKNRFEQEMIYYIERMDFSEEKTRLRQHCSYFNQIMQLEETAKGKKLGFVLQEVGREINTLGSKANHAGIQQLVIGMKDELEKAKEQILNAL